MDQLLFVEDEAYTPEQLKNRIQELEKLKKEIADERALVEIQKGLLEKQKRKSALLKKQLENQKILFDKQWQLLETETRRLAADRDKFEREKSMYKDKVQREARRGMSVTANAKIMFRGVNNLESLKKRYKELIKIYHPDNFNGDNELMQAITDEFEELKKNYSET